MNKHLKLANTLCVAAKQHVICYPTSWKLFWWTPGIFSCREWSNLNLSSIREKHSKAIAKEQLLHFTNTSQWPLKQKKQRRNLLTILFY